jgi:DMSO/TMAO reductase YedYZ heme-binding membrane subunit
MLKALGWIVAGLALGMVALVIMMVLLVTLGEFLNKLGLRP